MKRINSAMSSAPFDWLLALPRLCAIIFNEPSDRLNVEKV